MLTAVAEVFRHREAGKRRYPLQTGSRRRTGDDEDAALRRALTADRVDHPRDARRFLSDRDVDANNVALLLVDDAVDGNRGFADGAVADDQFALAAPERKHSINDQQPGLYRLADEIAIDDGGRRTLDGLIGFGNDGVAAVERTAKRIDDAAEKFAADRHARDLAGAVNDIAGFDRPGIVEKDATENIPIERGGKPDLAALETHQLAEPDLGQPADLGDSVGNPFDPADLFGDRAKRRRFNAPAGVTEPGLEPTQHADHGLSPICESPCECDRGRRASCCG